VRAVRPEVSRDYDVFFSSLGLLCGGILVFQGWRLDPLLFFGQLLTAGSALSFGVEAVRLRGELRDSKQAAQPPGAPGGRRRRRGGRGADAAQALPQPGSAPPRYGRWAGEAGADDGDGADDEEADAEAEEWRRFRSGEDDAWTPRRGAGGARRGGAQGGAFREAFESEQRAPPGAGAGGARPQAEQGQQDAGGRRGGAGAPPQWGGRTQDWE